MLHDHSQGCYDAKTLLPSWSFAPAETIWGIEQNFRHEAVEKSIRHDLSTTVDCSYPSDSERVLHRRVLGRNDTLESHLHHWLS